MRLARDRPFEILRLIYLCLLICLIVLVSAITAGIVYRVFFYTPPPKMELIEISRKSGEGQTFTGIGQLRVPTLDPEPGMVILLVSFVYYPDEKAFSEELSLRIGEFRDIIAKYISSFSIAELQKLGDENIKTELLRRFNSILRLGQIETLYFSEFMIIG